MAGYEHLHKEVVGLLAVHVDSHFEAVVEGGEVNTGVVLLEASHFEVGVGEVEGEVCGAHGGVSIVCMAEP